MGKTEYFPLLLLSTSCYNGEGYARHEEEGCHAAVNESNEGGRACYEGHARYEEEGCHAGNEGHGCHEGHARYEEEGCHAINEGHEGGSSRACYEGHAGHEEEGCHAGNEIYGCYEGHEGYEEVGLRKSDSTKNKMKDANFRMCSMHCKHFEHASISVS